MANVRGKDIANLGPLNFSFYFSSGAGYPHEIRVKPVFNPEKLLKSKVGNLKLCDDWEYLHGVDDDHVDNKDIRKMIAFFKKYIVLFCMVWDEQMQEVTLQHYFEGQADFNELLEDIDFYPKYKNKMNNIHDVEELETFCRKNNLVNFYGN